MKTIYTLNDGSTLCTMPAKEFTNIRTWQGNRIMDYRHVESIKTAIGSNIQHLDNGYKIIECYEADATGADHLTQYIIDGQHRAEVLRQYYKESPSPIDFDVVVLRKHVESEGDIIMYFNAINHTKSIQWKDPILLTNMYIAALESAFNIHRVKLIRNGSTHRPYLSVDKLRKAFLEYPDRLKGTKADIDVFIEKVKAYNTYNLTYEMDVKGEPTFKKASELQFTLAMNTKLKWISDLL